MRADKFHGNVFIANLPKDFTDTQVAEIFDPYGMVIGAMIARDAVTGESKGCALVNIAPVAAGERAVKALNGKTVGGRRVEVRLADPDMTISIRRSRPMPAKPSLPRQAPVVSRPKRQVLVEYRSLARRA